MKPRLLQRESMTNRVADSIRAAVISGEYQLGQKLREVELTRKYGVSNSVIREAFHILQGEGIVVADPYRGRSVFNLGAGDAKELVLIRTSFEALAAYLAAEKLTRDWEEKIRAAALEFKIARPSGILDWIRIELAFHRAVWGAARNEWLFQQLNRLAIPMFSINTIKYYLPGTNIEELLVRNRESEQSNSVTGHQLVAQFIIDRNPQKARESMILHQMAIPELAEIRKSFFAF
jgi:DNA-binding GntR family transcriptional regulator